MSTLTTHLPAPYQWQLDALTSWLRCGRKGVVEAVTGSGKTNIALYAIADARRRGMFALVVAPSRVLMQQWIDRLTEAFPDARIGRLGDNSRDNSSTCDILVTSRHSAASHRPAPPTDAGGLLVADECHGYGGKVLRKALRREYKERLGLTATFERSDDAVEELLLPYFGGVCFRYGFEQAINDGVCAQPRVAFVSVPLTENERVDYVAVEEKLVAARSQLRAIPEMPLTPFGEFLAAVNHLAASDGGERGRWANDYLKAFSKRRDIVASSSAKYEALGGFAEPIRQSNGALIFTETVRASNHAVNRLDPVVSIEAITGETGKRDREQILDDLRSGNLDAVAAPRVLDEGVDVPNANLGIVVSASRTRRQMIQRMGRILRIKSRGSGARFVIIFARNTLEDPAMREDRDGFLDEIERISEATHVFEDTDLAGLANFLDYDGPEVIATPTFIGPMSHGDGRLTVESIDDEVFDALSESEPEAWALVTAGVANRRVGEMLWEDVDRATLYAHLSYLPWAAPSWLHDFVWSRWPDEPEVEPEYLELEVVELPTVTTPKKKPKRLSTGDSPVSLIAVDGKWAVQCIGCGASSEPTQFKWQAMDETVTCTCWD